MTGEVYAFIIAHACLGAPDPQACQQQRIDCYEKKEAALVKAHDECRSSIEAKYPDEKAPRPGKADENGKMLEPEVQTLRDKYFLNRVAMKGNCIADAGALRRPFQDVLAECAREYRAPRVAVPVPKKTPAPK